MLVLCPNIGKLSGKKFKCEYKNKGWKKYS
jgi:hypothetical protein